MVQNRNLATNKLVNLYASGIFIVINLLSIIFIICPKLINAFNVNAGQIEHVSMTVEFCSMVVFAGILTLLPFTPDYVIPNYSDKIKQKLVSVICLSAVSSCLVAIFGSFYTDMYFLLKVGQYNDSGSFFVLHINDYLEQMSYYYLLWLIILFSLVVYYKYMLKIKLTASKLTYFMLKLIALLIPVITIAPLSLMNISQIKDFTNLDYIFLPQIVVLLENLIYIASSIGVIIVAFLISKKTKPHLVFLTKLTQVIGVASGCCLAFQLLSIIYPYKLLSNLGQIAPKQIFYLAYGDIKENYLALLLLILFTLAILGLRKYVKNSQFEELANNDNAGNEHGGSKWATTQNIKEYGFYDPTYKLYAGLDETGKRLFFPLANRTLLAPPGGGKTSAVAIPLGLLYNGPLFFLDVKAEIFAVIARHRFEIFKRKQIVLDPFNITSKPEFQYKDDLTKKPNEILQKFRINPFEEIPDDPEIRQRVISALASSFIVRDSETNAHFYDNAETLIRGFIDFIFKNSPKEEQNFITLLKLSQTSLDALPELIQVMIFYEGEAANAGSLLSVLAKEELGSLFSTTKRQLAWLTDINMQDFLSESNFRIDEIIHGNADIYVMLPVDAVKSHGRFIRMIIALIRGALIRLRPADLPEQKIVLLLDELAQLDKCPDIEQAIEIFRSYGLVVWSIFQFLSQIEKFDKPDVFTNATILQFFTNKDNETMKFIQDKFSKTTILQKTLSNNKGDQHQKNQVWGGSTSVGEGESVNSGGVEMVHFDQIREMSKDEQWFLVDNNRPIKAKKIPYYSDSFFKDCLIDPNPIEDRKFAKKIANFIKSQEQATAKDKNPQAETIVLPDEKQEVTLEVKSHEVSDSNDLPEELKQEQVNTKDEVPF